MEINGIAHIFLTASNFERSREFYRKLLPFLGLKPVIDTETTYYCVGGRTAVAIRKGGFLMTIGVGTVVVILLIVVIIYFVRRT